MKKKEKRNELDRIKFYNSNDLACGMMLHNVFDYLEKFDPSVDERDINDLIELYNIVKYIESGIRLVIWSDEDYEKLQSYKPILWTHVTKEYANVVHGKFTEVIQLVEIEYLEDFFRLFEKFELYSDVLWEEIANGLLNHYFHLYVILKNEKIVKMYGSHIRSVILSDPLYAELVLQALTSNQSNSDYRYYLPKELTQSDIDELFQQYIDTLHPNLNYLKEISNYLNQGGKIKISRELKYASKSKMKDLEQEIFSSKGHGLESVYEVSIRPQVETKKYEINGHITRLTFDSKWIIDNLDFPTLLNNFIYLFEYIDLNFRINILSNPNEGSAIERLILRGPSTDYFESSAFIVKNLCANIVLLAYEKFLKDHNVEIEAILVWYYRVYLLEEFGIKDFQISLQANQSDWYEKCKSISPEFESILKQYLSYITKGCVDHEYISNVIPDISYEKIPSGIQDKYAYCNGEHVEILMHHLFSDQSFAHYIPSMKLNEKNLYLQLSKNDVKYSDFSDRQKPIIDMFIGEKVLIVDTSNNFVKINVCEKLLILHDLYRFGFLSVMNYGKDIQRQIIEMKNNNELITENTLLSKQEASYFNFFLNNSEFGNAKGLRNIYAHGSPKKSNDEIKSDYFTFLKLLILLTIKIDDDIQLQLKLKTYF